MLQRPNIDMSGVGGYKASTLNSSNGNGYIDNNYSNINGGSLYEAIDYSDDSFQALTSDMITQQKIKWNSKKDHEQSNANNSNNNNDTSKVYSVDAIIEEDKKYLEVLEGHLDYLESEKEYIKDNLYNMALLSTDIGLCVVFPKCLYDLDVANSVVDDYSFEMVQEILVFYGIEDNVIPRDEYLSNVENGKYREFLYDTAGAVNVTDNFVSVWNSLCDVYTNYEEDKINIDPLDFMNETFALRDDDLYNNPIYQFNGVVSERYFDLYHKYGDEIYEYLMANGYIHDNGNFRDASKILYYAAISCGDGDELNAFKVNLKKSLDDGTFKELEKIMEQKAREVLFEKEFGELPSFADINFHDQWNFSNDIFDLTTDYLVGDNGYITEKYYCDNFKQYVYAVFSQRFGDNPSIKSSLSSAKVVVPSLECVSVIAYDKLKEIAVDRFEVLDNKQEEIMNLKKIVQNKLNKNVLLSKIYKDDFDEYAVETPKMRIDMWYLCDGMSNVTLDNYLSVMTDEEKKNFLYLYNKYYDSGCAEEYFLLMQEELNQRIGMARALEFVASTSNLGDVVGEGLLDGMDTFGEGIVNIFLSDGITSADEFEKSFKQMLLALKFNLWGDAYNISSSIGNMIIPMVASAMVTLYSGGVLTPTATDFIKALMANNSTASLFGSALMGLSSFGNSMEGARQSGMSYDEAIIYGALCGTSEMLLGNFLGSIPGLSNIKKFSNLSGFSGKILNFTMNLFSEGMEEGCQSILEPLMHSAVTGEVSYIDWDEVKKAGIYGMITAGLLNGGMIYLNGKVCSVDSINPKAVELIEAAEAEGIKIEYTEEMLTDKSKDATIAQQAIDDAIESSTDAEVETSSGDISEYVPSDIPDIGVTGALGTDSSGISYIESLANDIISGVECDVSSLSDVDLSQLYDILMDNKYFVGIPVSRDLFINNAKILLTSDLNYFYDTPNPSEDFKNMKPLNQLKKYNDFINEGLSESEALRRMYNDYYVNFVPKWAKANFHKNLETSYNNLLKYDSNLTWEQFLMFQLQIIPYNPEIQISNTYAAWQQAINDSSEMSCFWGVGSIAGLLNVNGLNSDAGYRNYNNGIGREAYGVYDDATFLLPGSVCELPDGYESWASNKDAGINWVANEVQLDTWEFKDCLFKIDIDMSLFPDGSIVPSNSHHLGANGAWSATMTPAGSNTFEAVGPRIENVIEYIDPAIQMEIDKAIIADDKKKILEIFGEAVTNNPPGIKFIDGITVTRLY